MTTESTIKFEPAPEREMTIEEVVDRCGELAARKAETEKEMSVLRKRIASAAVFTDGCKTTRLVGRYYVAKVERKEEIKYDKDALTAAMEVIGKDEFKDYFAWEFVPKAKKPEIDAYIKVSPHGKLIAAARKVREMAPSVSFVPNEAD
jgi:hypothetical protein